MIAGSSETRLNLRNKDLGNLFAIMDYESQFVENFIRYLPHLLYKARYLCELNRKLFVGNL